jgi:hypothetical protein
MHAAEGQKLGLQLAADFEGQMEKHGMVETNEAQV